MAEFNFSRQDLLESLHRDARLMLAFYLGEDITLEIPDMHMEIWDEFMLLMDKVNDPNFLTTILRKLLAIPRGHAKTTLVKLAVLVLLRFSKLSFCAYVSNTAPVAFNAILDILAWFESEQDQDLYGEMKVIRRSVQESLVIIEIRVPGQALPKRITLKGFGQGTQIRGTIINNKRPDFLVFDDIESREIVESEVLQRRLDSWATGESIKAMAAAGLVIFIGNMIGKTSLLARLSKDKTWNPTVLGSIVKAADGSIQTLWPAMWTLEALIADYHSYRMLGIGHVWEAEMMNLTTEDILGESLAGIWRPSEPAPDMIDAGFICLDPAFGLNGWNDFSGITVHVRIAPEFNPTMEAVSPPVLVRVIKERAQPNRLFDLMWEQSVYWGITTWVIETVAAQRLLIPLFVGYMNERQIPSHLLNFVSITGGKTAKPSRIVSFRQHLLGGSYGVTQELGDFVADLENYTPLDTAKHDDDLDSAAYGPIVWPQHGQVIIARGAGIGVAGMLANNGMSPDLNHVSIEERIP